MDLQGSFHEFNSSPLILLGASTGFEWSHSPNDSDWQPVWPRENRTVCPFRVFPCSIVTFLSVLRPLYVMRPHVVLLGFLLFCRHSKCFWGLGTQTHHSSFSTPKMPLSTLQNHYVLKGICPTSTQKRTITPGQRTQKDRWFHFHACAGNPSAICRSLLGKSLKKVSQGSERVRRKTGELETILRATGRSQTSPAACGNPLDFSEFLRTYQKFPDDSPGASLTVDAGLTETSQKPATFSGGAKKSQRSAIFKIVAFSGR